MNLNEDAVMPYQPDDEPVRVHEARAEAERQLGNLENVIGFGIGLTSKDEDAVIVFVRTKETLAQLPAQILGIPLIGDVTGEVKAL